MDKFVVNQIPIRTYRNHVNKGARYPLSQPLELIMSIWNGEAWAKNNFLFGQFDMKIKLIPKNSVGTIVAFYVYN